jgi:hypothetical protein
MTSRCTLGKSLLLASLAAGSVDVFAHDEASPATAEGETNALVYLYHACNSGSTQRYFGTGTGPKLQLDGEFIGYLAADSYIVLAMPEDSVEMALSKYSSMRKLTHQIEQKPGTRYLRFGFAVKKPSSSTIKVDPVVEEVDGETARSEIRGCDLNAPALERASARGFSRQ